MFSPKVTERNRELLSIELIKHSPFDSQNQPIFKPGFQVTPHSASGVEQANVHLDQIWDTRPLNTDEIRWIKNERAMCRASFLYWATRYGWIQNAQGRVIRFNPNLAQRIILDIMSRMEDKEIAIVLQILKARQEGVTTLWELIVLWRTMFHPNMNSLVASSRPGKSAEMVQKMDFCYNRQPHWLVPKIKSISSGEFVGFDDINSRIHIEHGAMLSGMGRSFTVQTFHLSELAEYDNASEAVDASLMRGAHEFSWLLGGLEGTGKTRSGWWYDKWNFNIEHWPLGEARMCPVFLPWYLLRDLYPTPDFLRSHPVRWTSWEEIPDLVKDHAKKAKEYVQSGVNDVVTSTLGADWEMPIEQMWWWWVERLGYEAGDKLNDFYRELPANAEEAFQSNNAAIFGPVIVESYRNTAREPIGIFGIRGSQTEIPIMFQAREAEIDTTRKPIEIHSIWGTGPSYDYTLYPLIRTDPISPLGKVIMYHPPKKGERYLIGTDTSNGVGKDNSCIEVICAGNAYHSDQQVLEFASPGINSFNLWAWNLAIGNLYAVPGEEGLLQPRQIIEGAANGENVYNELKKRGWSQFHPWLRYDKKIVRELNANRELWYTNSWSRPLMFDMLLDALNNEWLEINSPWFITEMSELELYETKNKIAAAYGQHDDRLMALGIALFSAHVTETKGRDGWKRRRIREQADAPEPVYNSGSQGSADPSYLFSNEAPYAYQVVTGNDPSYHERSSVLWTPDQR